MTMIIAISLLVAVASALPQNYDYDYTDLNRPIIPIIRDVRTGPDHDGRYSFDFETGNGISRQEEGQPGNNPHGAIVSQGAWAFTLPDGTPAQFNFVADENGYQPQSSLIPTPHPLTAHAIAQIEHAERERAAGIFHGGQYTPDERGQYRPEQSYN